MGAVNLTDFRANIAKHLDRLEEDRTHLIVTRQNHEAVVVLPLKDWEGMEETLYLLGNPANAAMLRRSIKQLDEGNRIEVDPETMQPIG
ncbi:MAG: type II toxin-antitoxin system Phd/YefM family antitoxin [Beijerinckiaceae bacterium]